MLENRLSASWKGYALMHDSDSLSVFGWGADLRIYEAKNGNKSFTYNTG